MTLRDYQQDARTAIHQQWYSGKRSTLCVLPTAAGKTVVAAAVILDMQPGRTLFVAHRRELLRQARKTIHKVCNLECGMEAGALRVGGKLIGLPPVVLAMMNTLVAKDGMTKRMGRFKPEDFSLLVIDEAHRGPCKSYQDIINYFKQNPNLKILGLTASPKRADQEALSQIFESVACNFPVHEAVSEGWIVDVHQHRVHVSSLDWSHIHTVAGELNQGELAKVMEAEGNIHGVVQATLEVMYGLKPKSLQSVPVPEWGQFLSSSGKKPKRTLLFTVTVLQAELMSNIFNRVIPGQFAWICGATGDTTRDELLRRFNDGDIAAIANVAVLTEGFDSPEIEVIVDAAPTKSLTRYMQKLGRALRPLPGIVDGLPSAEERKAAIARSHKPFCIILDFVGNSGRHKLVTAADVLGGKISNRAREIALKMIEKSPVPVNVSDALVEAERREREEAVRRKQQEEAKKAKLVAKANYTMQKVDPFDVFGISPVQPRRLDSSQVLTEKQRNVLLAQGVDPNGMPYEQARQLLDEIFRRWKENKCGLKLATVLKRKNLNTNISTEEAVRQIRGAALPIKMKVTQPEEGVIFELLPQR